MFHLSETLRVATKTDSKMTLPRRRTKVPMALRVSRCAQEGHDGTYTRPQKMPMKMPLTARTAHMMMSILVWTNTLCERLWITKLGSAVLRRRDSTGRKGA